MKHFINILDHNQKELELLLKKCTNLKKRLKCGICDRPLIGRTLMTIFEKPSTRTRISLEAAAASLGGYALTQELANNSRLGDREAIKDLARVISRYVDIIALRTFEHQVVEDFARYATVPVLNGLSDFSHPTQAMADIMTIQEHCGEVAGKHLVFCGDGNNVARSLAAISGRLGIRFSLASPAGYEFTQDFCSYLQKECPQLCLNMDQKVEKLIHDADVIYTDVWTSMGQEQEAEKRREIFAPFQLNAQLMAKAPSSCLIMHCLPAHRGEEITDKVIESTQSVVFAQAENRMHFYRGLFVELLNLQGIN